MNAAVFDFCKATSIELTRSRAYKKNDQAWVEQKNGAIVRRLVGYGRLRGLEATEALASLYQVSRLYINFFQPSFKLKSKTRHGAKVTKRYEAPLTPLERVLRSASIPDAMKRRLRARFRTLDPLDLLRRMREAQQRRRMQRLRWRLNGGQDSKRGPTRGFPLESWDSVAGRRGSADASPQSAGPA